MAVARDHDRPRGSLAEDAVEPLPGGGIAVPGVQVVGHAIGEQVGHLGRAPAILLRQHRQHHLRQRRPQQALHVRRDHRGHDHAASEHLPSPSRRARGGELAAHPILLRRAQHLAGRIVQPGPERLEIGDFATVGAWRGGEVRLEAELVRARHQPGFHHHQGGEVAEVEGSIDRLHGSAGRRIADRHPFAVGLQGGRLAQSPRALAAGIVLLGPADPAVVGGLMVVPLADPRRPGVGRLQVGVGAIEGVARAVVRQRQKLVLWRHRALEITSDAGRVGRSPVGVLVDVVAEVHDRVDPWKPGHRVVDVEQAALEVGAAEHRQHRILGGSGRQGARMPHGGGVLVEMKAVPVGAPGLEPADIHLDGIVAFRAGGRPAAAHNPAQFRILGHSPAHRANPRPERRDSGPDDQPIRRRITGGDAMQERGLGRGRIGLDRGRGRRQQAETQQPQSRAPIHPQAPLP